MKNSLKMTIIVPAYNAEEFLSGCLTGLGRQTLRDFEVVVINDGSTDATLEIAKKAAEQASYIRVFAQENKGSGAARNLGLEKAQGEFIAFLDADDSFYEDTTLEKLYNAAKEHNALIAGGSFLERHEGFVKTEFSGVDSGFKFDADGFVDYEDYQFDYGFYRFVYNRSFLNQNKIRFPNYMRFQDPPFFVEAMLKAKKFYAIKDICYVYSAAPFKQFSYIQARDCAKGVFDNLIASKNARLAKLHFSSLYRICNDFLFQTLPHITKENIELNKLLIKIIEAVDFDLINTGGIADYEKAKLFFFYNHLTHLSEKSNNLNRQIEDLQKEQKEYKEQINNLENKICELEREKEQILSDFKEMENSASFKIGRTSTYIPRKIRNIFKKK